MSDSDYTDTEAEYERLQAKAMCDKCIRDNRAQREKLAKEKLMKNIKQVEDQNQFRDTEKDDGLAAVLNDLTPEQLKAIEEDGNNNSNFDKVVKAAQDKFEEPIQGLGPINDGYAKIINSALR